MVLLNLATVTLLQTVSVTVVQSCLMLVSYPVVVQPCGNQLSANQRWAGGHVTSSPPITAHLLQLGLLQAQLLRLLSAQARQLQGAGPGHTRFVPGEC